MQLRLTQMLLPLLLSEIDMQLNTHMHYSDMTSDMETETGEMTLNANLYVDARGATPTEKALIVEIMDRHYKEIRSEINAIGRFA